MTRSKSRWNPRIIHNPTNGRPGSAKHELNGLQNRGYNIPDTDRDTVDNTVDTGEEEIVGDEVVTTAVVVSTEREVDVPCADALEDPDETVVGADEGAEGTAEEEEEGDPLVVGGDSVETEEGPTVEEGDAVGSV